MKWNFLAALFSMWFAMLTPASGPASPPASDPAHRVPVLVELFTSEGCSSCPPADALLMRLDREQPVSGAQIIALGEHVDYWNRLGWSDPFSSAQFSGRQETYSRALHADVYTPQLVVDGREQCLGSDARAIQAAVARAALRPKAPLQIVSAAREGAQAVVTVSAPAGEGEVWIAVADERDESNVQRGENHGRTLQHVAVVRHLVKAGSIDSSKAFEKSVRLPLAPDPKTGGTRIVAFIASRGGAILGTSMASLKP